MARSIELARVFYTIEAESKGLDQALRSSEKSLDRLGKFILANPVAAAGALGVALLGVAAKATQMAEEVDVAFRKIGALVPDFGANVKLAQRAIAELAVTTGKSQQELLANAQVIARAGVDGTTDLLNRLRVVSDLADAAGGDISSLANGLDQTLDVFQLASNKAAEVGAQLFAISRGKEPIEELMAALQAAAPSIRALGLDFETTTAALGTLLNQGLNAKQAGKVIKEFAKQGEEGAAEIRKLAAEGVSAAEAMKRLDAATRLVRESASRTAAGIKQEFNNSLIELGTTILPMVNTGLKALVGLLDSINGKTKGIGDLAAATTARTLGGEMARGRIDPRSELDTEKIRTFADAIREVRQGIRAGRLDLAALSKIELEQLGVAFDQFDRLSKEAQRGSLPEHLRSVTRELERGKAEIVEIRKQIDSLIAFRSAEDGKGPPIGTGAIGGGSKGKTPQEIAADLGREMEDTLVGLTDSMRDNTLLAMQRITEEVNKALATLPPTEAAALKRQLDVVLDAYRAALEEIQAQELVDRVGPIKPQLARETIPLRGATADDQTKLLAKQTKAVTEEEKKLADQREKAIAAARAQYQATETALRGVLQIASALGVMSDGAAQALTGLVQFGAGIKEFKVLQKEGASSFEKLSAGLGILGAAVSFFSAIGGLFSNEPSPEEQRRAELLKANNEVIRDLSRQIGELGEVLGDVSGQIITDVATALRAGIETGRGFGATLTARRELEASLARLGLSMADVRDVANGLGIQLEGAVPTFAEMQKILEALNAAELTQFAETYAGQLQALRLEFELFNISDPIEQLRRLQKLAKEFAGGTTSANRPEVLRRLADADLATQAGRDAAQAALEEIFKALQSGSLTPEQLGGLSTDQLLDFLSEFKRTLDEANKAAEGDGQGQSNQFAVQRTITEVQANLLASLLGTANVWAEATAKNTAALVALLSGSIPTGTLAPPAEASTLGGGTTYVDLTLYLTLPGVPDAGTATAIGGQVGDGLAAALDSAWGAKLRTRKLLSGNVAQV